MNISIGHGHTSYSAEALAIQLGLPMGHPNLPIAANQVIYVEQSRETDKNPKYDIGIFTDSMSNIETIGKGIAETRDQQVMLKALSQHNVKMIIHHVRGHKDIIRNNEADKICNIKDKREDRRKIVGLEGKKNEIENKIMVKQRQAQKNRKI